MVHLEIEIEQTQKLLPFFFENIIILMDHSFPRKGRFSEAVGKRISMGSFVFLGKVEK